MKFIFTVKIKEGHTEQEYIDAWKNGSSIIQKSLGAKGTTLYRKIGEPGNLIAIAEWDSKEARDAAMKKLDEADEKTKKILKRHRDFGETKILGNYEEVASVKSDVS